MTLHPSQVIEKLESTSSRLEKESILQSQQANVELFEGFQLALNPLITFGVKKVPESKQNGPGLSWDLFKDLCNKLNSRQLTGHAARDAIEAAMIQSNQDCWNKWYRRILIKDLRAGISDVTVNKVAASINKKFLIPIFSCQLAHDSSDHAEKMTGPKQVEIKLDGVRVLTIVYPNGQVDQFSRNGKELVNFESIKNQFASVSKHLDRPYVFDGEVMSSSFQDLMKQVYRKDNVSTDDAVLYLFDIVPLEDFQKGEWSLSQNERSNMLINWYEQHHETLTSVRVLEHELIDLSSADGVKLFKEINQKAIDGGYEGIMLKDPTAPYKCKRTFSWLKLKPFISLDLTAVAFEEGTGKNQGRLGAIVCEGLDAMGRFIRVNVGSGYSDDERNQFWQAQQDLMGKTVELIADAVTQNQSGEFSVRFPRFSRFRFDK